MKNIQLTHDFFSKDLGDTFKEYRWRYFLTNPLSTVYYFISKIKWFFQRANRGWADCDLWNMDAYLANTISSMSKALGKKTFDRPKNQLQPRDVILYNALKTMEAGFGIYNPFGTRHGCVAKNPEETEDALGTFKEYFTSLRLRK
jgi:hypothetical protein